MKTKFDEQLEEMHVELIKMGSLCEQAITLSSRALLGDEKSQVEQVYSVDGEIDQQEREIENICMRLLLLQRPFASDLRKISAALKMISDMERIGDQASDIADMVPYIRFSEAKSKVHIEAMAKATVKMVTDSVDAFVQDDLDLAQRVIDSDDEVDDLFNRVKNELIDLIVPPHKSFLSRSLPYQSIPYICPQDLNKIFQQGNNTPISRKRQL